MRSSLKDKTDTVNKSRQLRGHQYNIIFPQTLAEDMENEKNQVAYCLTEYLKLINQSNAEMSKKYE